MITWILEYLRVFFWGLEAEVLPELRFDCKETDAPFIFPGIDQGVRHRIFDGDLQLYARDVIRVMSVIKGRMPDAKCVVAVTSIDLYPAESWNFVFGLASKKNGVGVFSFARFAARNRMVELARCLKLMVHETSHMLGLTHCQTYACVMNGVNNIREADLCPMYLCPLCLEKMSLAQPSLDVVERYRQLSAFCSKIGLTEMESWCVRRLESLLPAPSVPVPPSGEVLVNAFCQMDLKGEELSGNLGCK